MIHSNSLSKMNGLKNQMVPVMLEMQTAQVTPVKGTNNSAQLRVGKADFNSIYLDILNIHDSIVNHLQTIVIHVYSLVEKSLRFSRGDSSKELHTGGGPHRSASNANPSCANITNDEHSDSAGGGGAPSSSGAIRTGEKQPFTEVDRNAHVKIEPEEGNSRGSSEHANVGHRKMPNNQMDTLADSSETRMMDPTDEGRTNQSVSTHIRGEYHEGEENTPSINTAKELKCTNELAKMICNYDAPVELIINQIESKKNKCEKTHGENPHKGNNPNVEEVIKENKLNLRKHIVLLELLKHVMVHSSNATVDLNRDQMGSAQMGGNNDTHRLKKNWDFLKRRVNPDESICCDYNFCNANFSGINIGDLNIISYYMDLLSPFNKFHGERRGGDSQLGESSLGGEADGEEAGDADGDIYEDTAEHAQLTLVRKKLDDIALNYDYLVEDILKNNNVNGFNESYLYGWKDKILQGGDAERASGILPSDLKSQPNGDVHSGRYVGGASIGSGTVLSRHTPYSHFAHTVEGVGELPNEHFLRSVNPFPGGNSQEGEVPNWGPPSGSITGMASVALRPGRNNPIGGKAVHHNGFVPKGCTFADGGGALHQGGNRISDEGRRGDGRNPYDNLLCEKAQSYNPPYNVSGSTSNQVSSTDTNYPHAIWMNQISKEHGENSNEPITDDTVMKHDHYSAPTMLRQESNLMPQDRYNQIGNDHYGEHYKGGYASAKNGFSSYLGNFKNGIKMEGKKEHFLGGSEITTCTGQNYSNDTNSGDLWGGHPVGALHAEGRGHLGEAKRSENEGDNPPSWESSHRANNTNDANDANYLHLAHARSGSREARRHHGGDTRRDTETTHARVRSNKHDGSHYANDKHFFSATAVFDDGAHARGFNAKRGNPPSGGASKGTPFDGRFSVHMEGGQMEGEQMENASPNRDNDSSVRKMPTSSLVEMHHKSGDDSLDTQFCTYLPRSNSLNSYNRPSCFSSYAQHLRGGLPSWDPQNYNSLTDGGTNYGSYKNRQCNDGSSGRCNNNTDGRGSNNSGGYSHSGGGGNKGVGRSNDSGSNDNDGDDDENGEHRQRGRRDYYDEKEDEEEEEDENEHQNGHQNEHQKDGRGKGHPADHPNQHTLPDGTEKPTNNQFHMNTNDGCEREQHNGANQSNSESRAGDPNAHSQGNERGESFLEDHQLIESAMNEAKFERHGNSSGAPNRLSVDGARSQLGRSHRGRQPSQANQPSQTNLPNQANMPNLPNLPNLPDGTPLGSSCTFIPFGGQVSFQDPSNYGPYGGFENFGNYVSYSNFGDRSYGSYTNCGTFSNSSGVQPRRGDRAVARSALTHSGVETPEGRSRVLPPDELRIRSGAGGAGGPMGANNQVQLHNQMSSPMSRPMSSHMSSHMSSQLNSQLNNELYRPHRDAQNNAGERNRPKCKPSMVKVGEKNESMGHDFINFTNSAYVDIHKIIQNDDLLKNELTGLEESLQLANAASKGSKKNTAKYNSNELEILMMYDSCKNMLKSCSMLRNEEMKNAGAEADADEYLLNETCIPANVLTNSEMMSDSLNADIEKIIDIMSTSKVKGGAIHYGGTAERGGRYPPPLCCRRPLRRISPPPSRTLLITSLYFTLYHFTALHSILLSFLFPLLCLTDMQAKGKDKKRKLSSIGCPPNDRAFPNGEKNPEHGGDKSSSKKMPRSSEDKRKKYQKMDIRTLNKSVQKNKEVCKNCYIHYDNSKSSYILTFINRKQKKQRKLFPVNPNEKDEAYVIQIMNYIEKLKDQEKIFGISKNDEMGALQRGEPANLHRSEGGKNAADRRSYEKDQRVQEKHMVSEPYGEANLPKKNEMCPTNLNLLNKKMNNFLSGINDQLYMDPSMNFIPEHLPFIPNVGGNPNMGHVNIYDDVNAPSGVDYVNFNLLNEGHSFENMHLMNQCSGSVQNVNPFFKLHSKKGDFSARGNDQYVGGEGVHGGVPTDMNSNMNSNMNNNSNNTSCRNVGSGMSSLAGRRGNRRAGQVGGGSHTGGGHNGSGHNGSGHNGSGHNRSSHNGGNRSSNSPFAPNTYESAMMHQAMKNAMYPCESNQAMSHQKGPSSANPTNANDEFGPMNMFTNASFPNYNQGNMPNSCESEMMHHYNSVMNDYGDSMLVESNYDSDRVTAGGRTMQHNE
ncbi:hypothetical protein PVMG_00182 [Plasmodium vivax Mauritania I]|uniref:Uncharacterized protein n=1 Tax=Plasmodium vivax Mauritania I TaxID=1035515 RepID=A0A0J9VUN1_PLAVI|nr:hypothetical protein PVMG_00182 [Plasmodium vivax Mauritania I]